MSDIGKGMRKSNSYNCYSGAVSFLLKEHYFPVEERQILLQEDLLRICCKSKYDAIYCDFNALVNTFLTKSGLIFKNILVHNFSDMKKLIIENQYVLAHVNCTILKYAKIFCNSHTYQNKHYILINECTEGEVSIIDKYIPGVHNCEFCGNIKVNDIFFETSEFYIMKSESKKLQQMISPNAIKKIDDEIFVKIIDNFLDINNLQIFNSFICNLNDLIKSQIEILMKQKIIYEMSVAMSVSGLISVRKFWVDELKSNYTLDEKSKLELELIPKWYNQIRIMLLKISIKYDENELGYIVTRIRKLQNLERSTYSHIKKLVTANIRQKRGKMF